ncbi:hypothetical protein H0H93_013120 [Arthromyces matolae]|nr:hypothetical protein H0H93_013120 [Arthromyces matolae]
MAMAYKVLDVRARMLGAMRQTPSYSGVVADNDKATMALLNDLPDVLSTAHEILTAFVRSEPTAPCNNDLSFEASPICDPAFRLYSSLRVNIAKESYHAIIINLTAAAAHLRCLLKGNLILPTDTAELEAMLAASTNSYDTENIRTIQQTELKRFKGKKKAGIQGRINFLHNTLYIALAVSPIMLLVPRRYHEIGSKETVLSSWRLVGGLDRPKFIDDLELVLWQILFAAASSGSLVPHIHDLISFLNNTISIPVVKWIDFGCGTERRQSSQAVNSAPSLGIPPTAVPQVTGNSDPIDNSLSFDASNPSTTGEATANNSFTSVTLTPGEPRESSDSPAPLQDNSAETSNSNDMDLTKTVAHGENPSNIMSHHSGEVISESTNPSDNQPDLPNADITLPNQTTGGSEDNCDPNAVQEPSTETRHGVVGSSPDLPEDTNHHNTNDDSIETIVGKETEDIDILAHDITSRNPPSDKSGVHNPDIDKSDVRRSGRLTGKNEPGSLKEPAAPSRPPRKPKPSKYPRKKSPSRPTVSTDDAQSTSRIFIDLTLEDTAYTNYEVALNLKDQTRVFTAPELEIPYTGHPEKIMKFTPSFHIQQDLDWFMGIYEKSCARRSEDTKVKIIDYTALRTMKVEEIFEYLRLHACILVINEPHDDPGFTKKFFSEICSLNAVTTIHDMRYSSEGRTRQGSPLDMFRAMIEPIPIALNCLNLLDTQDRFNTCIPWSTDAIAWRETRGRPYCPPLEPFPVSDVRWWLAATPTTLHHWHIDASGMNTILRVETGGKLWVVGLPKSGRFEEYAQTRMYDRDYDLSSVNSDRWDLEMIVMGPGSTLIMRPNLPHAVITPFPTICRGGHFYSTPTLKDSVFGLYHHFAADLTITNTEHNKASYALMSRILVMLHRDIVEPQDPELDRDYSHIPSLDDWSQVVNLLTFCCYFELYSATIDWGFDRSDMNHFEMSNKNRSLSRLIADHFFRTRVLKDPVTGEEISGIVAMSIVYWKMVAVHARTLIELESIARKEELGSNLNNQRETDMDDLGMTEANKRSKRSSFVKQNVEWCIIDGPAWTTYSLLRPDELNSTFDWCGPNYVIRKGSSEYGLVYGDTQVAERLNVSLQHISTYDRFAAATYVRQSTDLLLTKRPRESDSGDDMPHSQKRRLS